MMPVEVCRVCRRLFIVVVIAIAFRGRPMDAQPDNINGYRINKQM